MSKCGCCGEYGHSVSKCRSSLISEAVVVLTETPLDEMSLTDAVLFLRQMTTWKLTAMLNYLGNLERVTTRNRKMKKNVKIGILVNVWRQIKRTDVIGSNEPRRQYKVYADELFVKLCQERGVTNIVDTNWNFLKEFLKSAIYEMIDEFHHYDLVKLVNQHFLENLQEVRTAGLIASRRYINNIYTSIQEEAVYAAKVNKDHLKPLQISVNSTVNLELKENKECVICVDPQNNTFVQANCGHVICQVCVLEIASQREKSFILCPFCREEISALNMTHEQDEDSVNNLRRLLVTM